MKKEIVYIIGHRSNNAFRIRNCLLVVKWLKKVQSMLNNIKNRKIE